MVVLLNTGNFLRQKELPNGVNIRSIISNQKLVGPLKWTLKNFFVW